MRAIIIPLLLFFTTGIQSTHKDQRIVHKNFPCRKCDHIVKGYWTNGSKLNIKPGEVVCLDASIPYEKLRFVDIRGTAGEPVIIRNCDGVATVSSPGGFAIKFETSSNFRLLGDGSSKSEYGIKVINRSGFYVTMEKFTTDFEVAHLEIAGPNKNGLGENAGFAGIGIKTSPYQDCDLFTDSTRQAWIMRNVRVHHNYIHDVGGEGLYIGHGFYKGRVESQCSVMTYSHSIHGLRVHHNIVENTGYDGIQIKNADADCEIHHNIIRNYGNRNHPAQNEGLFIGEGVTGKIYNNLIDTGTGNGIQFQGMGNNEIFNNIVINAGEDGLNLSWSKMGVYIPDGYFHVFNNTIIDSKADGFVCYYNNEGGPKKFINNLVVKAGERLMGKGSYVELANNIFTQDSAFLEKPYITTSAGVPSGKTVAVIDSGMDVRIFCPMLRFDFYDNPRPMGKTFDIGAIEYQ